MINITDTNNVSNHYENGGEKATAVARDTTRLEPRVHFFCSLNTILMTMPTTINTNTTLAFDINQPPILAPRMYDEENPKIGLRQHLLGRR
jgi:hypothetical protein